MSVCRYGWKKVFAGMMALTATVWGADPVDSMKLATTPADRLGEPKWKARHEQLVERAKQGGWDLVFLGDSITQGWEGGGKDVWAKRYAGRKAVNLGISGDRTEHVLWRIDQGLLNGLSPKLVVLMLGTNNTGHRKDSPEAIAAGMDAVLKRIKEKLPGAKILLLAIFPRGAKTSDPMRVNNDSANEILNGFADKKTVFFLNVNDALLEPDGTLSKEIMPDLLHPNAKGYERWAEAMEPPLAELLGEKK